MASSSTNYSSSVVSERAQLAKLCSSRDWSKAIRVLDSLLSQSCVIQDICNRAFCYSQLELHKHVIKDCDKALKLDPTNLQAYILKGRAYSALGKQEDAFMVWEQGYGFAIRHSADLKQLLELEELLAVARKIRIVAHDRHDSELHEQEASSLDTSASTLSEQSVSYSVHLKNGKLNETSNSHSMSNLAYRVRTSEVAHEQEAESLDTSASVLTEHSVSDSVHLSTGNLDETSNNHSMSNLAYKMRTSEPVQIKSKPKEIFDTPNGYSNRGDGPKRLITQPNGTKFRQLNGPDSVSEIWDGSEVSSSVIDAEVNDDTGMNGNICFARISDARSINVDFRLSRAISQVNEGQYARAISIFDKILKEDPMYPEALIGRGTAYAFKRELDSAIADFTKALQSNPSAGEAWKRRGQARAALGEPIEAIVDLTKALEFEPNSAEIFHERGIVHFQFKDFNAAVKDLSACVKLDKNNRSAYTYLGLSLASIGEYTRAEEAYKRAIHLDQHFLEAWGNLIKLYHDLANSEKALSCLKQVLQIDERFVKAYYLYGLLLHGMGDHRNAIKHLSAGLTLESSNVDCLYLRASCYHAVGEYKEAVKDYDGALNLELDSMDKFVLQCMAFYQKEIALYTASKISSEFCWFDIDEDVDPLFKEFWCKRLHPKEVCEKVYRQPPLRESFRKGKLKKQDFTFTKQKTALLLAADRIGKKIQYHCPGFLPNRRQHRMAGLAAIEIAQKVSKAWRLLQLDWKNSNKDISKHGKRPRRRERLNILSQNRGGAGCSTSSNSETSASFLSFEEKTSDRCVISWSQLYSLAVRWRQISEPCDPVVWINKLSEEFNSGFGSETPLIHGQAKVVRYFSNTKRVLDVAKAVIKEKRCVHKKSDDTIDLSKDAKLKEVMRAKTCEHLYRVVGEDFWLATWCNSTIFEGRRLEGTRITLVKKGECGIDFAIRTPCTPARWDDFDTEMTAAWEVLCNAVCGETYGSTGFDLLENVRDAILRMSYYWYNFMPLSRGTSSVGFIVLLGLLLAANMEFAASIPEGVQVDWEAILNFEPDSFVASVKSWLYPALKISTSWKDYPDVASTFETTGSVVAALSTYSD